eukprot:381878_1
MSVVYRKKDEDKSEMSPKRLIKICRKKGLYETPRLNDSLYLNYEGFSAIKSLEPYFNIKSLFLEGNFISEIENISHLKYLCGLYLQNNTIKKISNLDGLLEIKSLNFANNQINKIENISHLTKLETLNLENNLISTTEDVEEILHNETITTLNLNGNKFKTEKEGMKLIKLLSNLPNLRSLYLKRNPFINEMDWYRKRTISVIRTLTFLDDRPVFENERRLNDAWSRGGPTEETKEKQLIQQEKIDKRNLTRKIRREKYEARKKAMFERIEREQKERETKEQESQPNDDDISEESKQNDLIGVNIDINEQKIDAKTEQQKNTENSDEENNLPGMVNTHLHLQ